MTKKSQVSFSSRYYLFSNDGQEAWESDRLTDALKRVTCSEFGVDHKFGVSTYRHLAISMGRRFLKKPFEDEDSQAEEEGLDLQAAHSSAVADRFYPVNASTLNELTESSMNIFGLISRDWHKLVYPKQNLLAQSEVLEGVTGTKTKDKNPESVESITQSATADLVREIGQVSVQQKSRGLTNEETHIRCNQILNGLYGNDAKFKSVEQKEALAALLKGVSPLVVVLPTGGGKSILLQGPSLELGAGVTVLISPFIALSQDIVRRASTLKLDCQLWGKDMKQDSQLLVVTVESAVSAKFRQYIRRIKEVGRLDRVVVDEAHMLVTMVNFRESFTKLDWFTGIGVQCIFLTATLPSWMEPELRKAAFIPSFALVRARVSRSNIAYSVLTGSRTSIEKHLDEIMSDFSSNTNAQALIYTRSCKEGENIARTLNCSMYHSRTGDKDAILDDFANGKSRILVATTALGAGIDIPNITLVVHFKIPYGFVDFSQGSGRAGRNGNTASSVVLVATDNIDSEKVDIMSGDREAMTAYCKTSDCRRIKLGEYFDGYGMRCILGSDELCDNCLRKLHQGEDLYSEDEEVASLFAKSIEYVPVPNVEDNNEIRTSRASGLATPSSSTSIPDVPAKVNIAIGAATKRLTCAQAKEKVAINFGVKLSVPINKSVINIDSESDGNDNNQMRGISAASGSNDGAMTSGNARKRRRTTSTIVSSNENDDDDTPVAILEKPVKNRRIIRVVDRYEMSRLPAGAPSSVSLPLTDFAISTGNSRSSSSEAVISKNVNRASPEYKSTTLRVIEEMRVERVALASEYWHRIEGAMPKLAGSCGYCWMGSRVEAELDHPSKECTGRYSKLSLQGISSDYNSYWEWRNVVKCDQYACCFRCQLPQHICKVSRSNMGQKLTCKYGPHVIMLVVYVAQFIRRLRVKIKGLMGVEVFNPDEYTAWIGKLVWVHGQKSTNLMRVFDMAIDI
ncbi:uncharacterized protein LAJ45_11349 [Morchella importuna]|uniref:uncharacterized protein n=1 Tax=Morchella importuna TaxID=1174673 RepID=UPI001E8CCB3D|nr:uncharacterized protein LAJ45_11349 [Morchella importuna]KAH8144640.1 hypothetical protein LAJ45_11349 [Morchella importuna]